MQWFSRIPSRGRQSGADRSLDRHDLVGNVTGESEATSRRSQLFFIYGSGLAIGLQSAMMNYALWRRLPSAAFVLAASVVYSALVQVLWQWVLPRKSRLVNLQRVKTIVPWFGGRFKLVMRNPTASEVELSRAQARVLRRRMHW
jgi:hypothetical protein